MKNPLESQSLRDACVHPLKSPTTLPPCQTRARRHSLTPGPAHARDAIHKHKDLLAPAHRRFQTHTQPSRFQSSYSRRQAPARPRAPPSAGPAPRAAPPRNRGGASWTLTAQQLGRGGAALAPGSSPATLPGQTHLWEGGVRSPAPPALTPPVLQTQTLPFPRLHQKPRRRAWGGAGSPPGHGDGQDLDQVTWHIWGGVWMVKTGPTSLGSSSRRRRPFHHPAPGRPETWAVGQKWHGTVPSPRETPLVPTSLLWGGGPLAGSHLARPSPRHFQTLCPPRANARLSRTGSGSPTATVKSPVIELYPWGLSGH